MAKFLKEERGISMTELVIVVAVVGFLTLLLVGNYLAQLRKGRDGKRKSDLERIKVAFEDYFNDNGCYPSGETVEFFNRQEYCFSEAFQPWLRRIPCDPSGRPYRVVVEDSPCPSWYAVYTNMEYSNDPQVVANPCFSGCIIEDESYNFAIASGNISPEEVASSTGEATPTPSLGVTGEPTATPTLPDFCNQGCYRLVEDRCNGPLGSGDDPCPRDPSEECYTDPACSLGCQVDSCSGG